MNEIKNNQVNMMSWEEYGSIVNILSQKIEQYLEVHTVTFDAIAPIMRSGGVTGNILGVKLNIEKVIPLQLRYYRNPDRIKVLIHPKDYSDEGSSITNILICETNTVKGFSADKAIKLLKSNYPDSNLYYATLAKVFGGPDTFDGIEEYFYGVLTDDKFRATENEMEQYNIRPGITIYPWESIEDELKEIYTKIDE
jgi:hypoxanthine phosphoribosyltransferase